MNEQQLTSKIVDYVAWSHLWHRLEPTHTNDELNDLALKFIEVEETILSHFGLPCTFKYSEMFQLLALRDDFELAFIPPFIQMLKDEAEEYLNGSVLTDLQLLQDAQEQRLLIDEVLPELSFRLKPEPYYTYLYEALLLTDKITPQQLLNELTIIAENDLSLQLNKLSQDRLLIAHKEYRDLWHYGLTYIKDFWDNYEIFKANQVKKF